MAGGGGTRFWPLSRQDMPKQLLNLSGDDAMINETIKRCVKQVPIENIFIVTNKKQAIFMDSILIPEFPKGNIIQEPMAKNTAACILYSSLYIYEKYGDGILTVLPSDHYITEPERFLNILEKAIHLANESNQVITLGIKPTFPSVGYGYIKGGDQTLYGIAQPLERFVEKPNFERAKEYLNSGQYYWNSGMFIWKLSVVLALFDRFLPRMYKEFKKLEGKVTALESGNLLEQVYKDIENISVDYGILERLDEAMVIPSEFGWNDVGSWDALGAVFPSDLLGNIVKAEHIGVDTKECIIYGSDKLLATVGIHNTIIVDTKDALLICAKDRAQEVKVIVEKLKEQGKIALL